MKNINIKDLKVLELKQMTSLKGLVATNPDSQCFEMLESVWGTKIFLVGSKNGLSRWVSNKTENQHGGILKDPVTSLISSDDLEF